jgi:hypothetical protein
MRGKIHTGDQGMRKYIKDKNYIDVIVVILCFIIPVIIYWDAITQNKILISGDGINFFVPKIFQNESISNGEIPLWNSYVITGISLIADPNNTYFYPFNALGLIFPTTLFTNLYYIIHLGLAGIFTYIFLKKSTGNRIIAFAGAIVFSSSIVIGGSRREHGWVYTSVIWMPLVLYFIQSYIKTRKIRNIVYSSLTMAIQFFGGNPQIALYSDILASIYFVYYLIYDKYSIKEIIRILFIWVGGYIAFAAIELIPMIELIIYSSRANASQIFCLLSTRWELLLMTLFPYIFGDIVHPLGDYGSAEISIEIYIGIIPLIYAVYATRYFISNRLVKFASIAVILAFVYSSSCNIPIMGDILQKIPVLNYFRVQSRILYIYAFFGICCFAFGIYDIKNPEHIKRILVHSIFILGVIIFTAAVIAAIGRSPMSNVNETLYYSFNSSLFRNSIAIALINVLLIGIIYIIKDKTLYYKYGSYSIIIILIIISIFDIGRFSWKHQEIDIKTLMQTEEINTLKSLLQNDPYRIITDYDSYTQENYVNSGLSNNWSMISQIRNIKGRTEFENPQLNELLVQSESRDNSNINKLISNDDILSMLSVKYLLMPINKTIPIKTPDKLEREIINRGDKITTPGNNKLYIDSIPISIEIDRYYQIDINVSAIDPNDELFYVDFYGGPSYDSIEQQQLIPIKNGYHNYTTVLFSGEKTLPANIIFRIVCKTNNPITLSNIKVTLLSTGSSNSDYTYITRTSKYNIYELNKAQKILYIPNTVKNIENENSLREKPEDYPDLDKISYINGINNYSTDGSLIIMSISNNRLTARVIADNITFVNHAQSYYPGWKAYIDGKQTNIYLVNGIIQGIKVPSGNHIIKFIYDPISFKIGAFISITSLLLSVLFIVFKRKR